MFVLSRVAWLVFEPLHFAVLLLAVSLVARWFKRTRLASRLAAVAMVLVVVLAVVPGGEWVLALLENRFPQPSPPEHVDGIIVLGGAINPANSVARGQVSLNES